MGAYFLTKTKMQTLKQKGFTLIELLVVIVIIGILATISVATFSGYFAKARDTERQTAVSNAATILKTARAVESLVSFGADGGAKDIDDKAEFDAILLSEGGYKMPADAATTGGYGFAGDAQDFVVFSCSEENVGKMFAAGTVTGVAAAQADVATICADPSVIGTAFDVAGNGDVTPINVTN